MWHPYVSDTHLVYDDFVELSLKTSLWIGFKPHSLPGTIRTTPSSGAGWYLFFWNPYNISNLKPKILIYLLRWVLYSRGTREIILTFFWYKINKITYYLDPIIPILADIGVDICIPIFRYYFFQNRYCIFLEHQYNTVRIFVYCTALLTSAQQLSHRDEGEDNSIL